MAEALPAAGWLIPAEWRAHPARLVAGILAIATGIALGFAVHLVNQTALASFDRAMGTVNGTGDFQIQAATPAGFAEDLYPRVARTPGVAMASPVVELAATSGTVARVGAGRPRGRFTLIGVDLFRAAAVTPALVGAVPKGGPGGTARLDGVFLSATALALTGAHVGGEISIDAAGREARFRVAGLLPAASEGQALAVIDIAEAQWRFGQLGRLQRIDVRLAAGADRDRVAAAIARQLPADAAIVSPEASTRRSDSLSRAYRVNLGMLAMVALLTGGFLVHAAQSLSVARRRPQFALLRVLGMTRAALTRQIVVEGLVLGGAGAVLGLALGFGLATLAVQFFGGDLGGGYFDGSAARLEFPPLTAAIFALLGIGVAVASSLGPAREAGQAQPAVALKSSGEPPRRRPPRALPGLALLAAGGLAALAPPLFGLPIAGYAAMALLLAGGVAIMPWLAAALLAPLARRPLAPPLELAVQHLAGAPRQAAVALSGIVASTSLMVAMAVMVASFRGSVDDWLGQVLPSDLYLHLEGAEAGGIDPAAQARLAATPGVARIRFIRALPLRLAADQPAVMLSAQPLGPAGPDLPLVGRQWPVPAGATPVWVSEPVTWLYPVRAGDWLTLPLGGANRRVFVAGVWRDYARQFGAIAIGEADFTRLTGDASRTEAAIDLAPGATAPIPALTERLPAAVRGQALFARPAEMRAVALRLFDRSFAITYALEAIAIAIGLAGVAATFSAQTLARVREFGMLRHIGVTRRQIVAMLGAEGALLGAVGAIAGIGLGLAMAQVLIHVVNPQSFHWTMDTRLPWGLLGLLAAALVAAAAGTALLAGRRALSADAVRAVRDDW